MISKPKFGWRSVIIGIVSMIFLLFLSNYVYSLPTMSFDKNYYAKDDVVNIKITDSSSIFFYDSLILEVSLKEDPSYYLRYLGSVEDTVSFVPKYSGEYVFRLYNSNKSLIEEKSFLVYVKEANDCQIKLIDSEILIDLENYGLYSNNILPSQIELIYSHNGLTNKIIYSDEIESKLSYFPDKIGKYSLYAQGKYLECFDVVNLESYFLENSNETNSILKDVSVNYSQSSQNNIANINTSNKTISSNLIITLDNSFVQSETGRLKKKISLFNVHNSKSENLVITSFVYAKEDASKKSSLYANYEPSKTLDLSTLNSDLTVYDVNSLNDVFVNSSLDSLSVSNMQDVIATSNSGSENSIDLLFENISDVTKVEPFDSDVEFSSGSVQKIKFKNLRLKETMDIGVDELSLSESKRKFLNFAEKNELKGYAVNLYDLNFTESSFISTAIGTELWKCKDWNFTTQSCFGSWTKLMDLVPGQEYNVSLYPGDPGFIETVDVDVALDISMLAIDNSTIVVAWIKNGTTVTGAFEIWNTNGSVIVDETIFDSAMNAQSRVALGNLNSNEFIIGAVDSSATTASFYFYNRTGSLTQASTTVSSAVGTLNDVDICQLGDRFVYAYMDGTAGDASFQIWNNSGNSISAIIDVDTGASPGQSLQNLISCGVINSTRFLYSWYDAGTADDITVSAYADNGASIVGATDLDTAVGNAAQVESAGLRNRRVAVAFYDAADQDITLTIRQLNGGTLATTLAVTDIDNAAGASSRVSVSEINNPSLVNSSYVVVAWYDSSDTTVKAAVYNETGSTIVAPFNVTITPTSSYPMVATTGYESNLNKGLCDGTFAVGYTNSSGDVLFSKYYSNGSLWDGWCNVPPSISLLSPSNGSIIYSRNTTFNFSVSDDRYSLVRNCSLYTNQTGTFTINQTYFNISTNINQSFNMTLGDGNYIWNVRCFDNSSSNAFASFNYTVLFNNITPNIFGPRLNVTILNQSEYVRFNVSINDSWGINVSYVGIIYPDLSEQNITLLRNGSHHYLDFNDTIQLGKYSISRIYANDSLGQITENSSIGLTFNVTASPPLVFNLSAPLNKTVSSLLTPNMSWQQTIDTRFANYTLILDKDADFLTPDYIYSLFPITNTSYVLEFALDVNSIYYWRVIAYDIFGNSRNSTNDFIYITDNLAPEITLNLPTNNSYVTTIPILFNYTPVETNTLGSCSLYLGNSSVLILNQTNSTPINNADNYFSIPNISDGTYLWNIYCNDSLGFGRFSSTNYTVLIDRTPPNITLISPSNNSYINTSNIVLFVANATDFMTNVTNCSIILNNVFSQMKYVTEGIAFNFTEFLLNGNYTWKVNCTDSNGFIGSSPVYNFTLNVIDSDPPLITRNSPATNAYLSNAFVLFNYTAEDSTGVQNCSLYINGTRNQTDSQIENFVFNYFNATFNQGIYVWNLDCYDNSSQKNYIMNTNRTFTVDLTNPSVNLNAPSNNMVSNNPYVLFNYTPNDSHLSSCDLYANFSGVFELNQSNSSPNSYVENYFESVLSDGVYSWNILCTDLSLRSSFAFSNRTFTIDTIAPEYLNFSVMPSNPYYSVASLHIFNSTWNDVIEVDTVWMEANFFGSMQNFSPSINGNNYSVSINNLSAGTYYYRWFANDTAGNINFTSNFEYIVTKSNSSITLLINGSSSNLSINEDISLNLSAIIGTPSNGYVELFVNSMLISNGSSPIQNNYLFNDPGVFEITAFYSETQNYSNSSRSYFVFVNDTTSPNITLVSPNNNSFIATGIGNLQYIVYDNSSIINCSLYLNETYNQTSYNVTTGSNQVFSVSLPEGSYSWYVSCTDASLNYAQTLTRIFSAIDNTQIKINISLPYSVNDSHQIGELATFNVLTTDAFDNPLNVSLVNDVIFGNTSLNWWNTSWNYRMPIMINYSINRSRNDTLRLNITGLTVSNCTQLRVVENSSSIQTNIPYRVISGNNLTYCELEFSVALYPMQANSMNYHVYYGTNVSTSESSLVPVSGIRVQRGVIQATGATITVDIESVNRSKSFVIFTSHVASSGPNQIQLTSDLSLDTQVRFERYLGTTAANISWQVIEGEDIFAQRNVASFAAATSEVNVTITSVNLSKSFILVDGRVNSGTAGTNNQGTFFAQFINDTTIRIRRQTTGTAATAGWQVVEWQGANVQSGNATFTTIRSNATISQINLSRSFAIISKSVTGDTGGDANLIFVNFTNSTMINFARSNAIGTATVSWFAIELPVEYKVQTGTLSIGATDQNVAINSVLMEKTFTSQSWASDITGTVYVNTLMTTRLTNKTNIFFDKQSTTNTNTVTWYAIESIGPTASVGNNQTFKARDISESGVLGLYTWYWDTFNQTLGLYSEVSSASKSNFTTSRSAKQFFIIPDTTRPNVTLISPNNATIAGAGLFNFSYLPFDYHLQNCSLYVSNGGAFNIVQTNTSILNNQTNIFSNQFISPGFYNWNVGCYDSYNNLGFSPYNYTLNITGPDLKVNRTDIWFSSNSLVEGTNITIFANITNQGLSPANESFIVQFFKGDPDSSGIQIGSDFTIINLSVNEIVNINTSYILSSGVNTIFVRIDYNNFIDEADESNNKGNNSLDVGLYQYYFGNVSKTVVLGTSFGNSSIFLSQPNATADGYLFIADSDSTFSFANLQAISRNINNNSVNNDFSDLDVSLNASGSADSLNIVWANGTNLPLIVKTVNLTSKLIPNVPFINSTNSSGFETGILWDTGDDISVNLQYDSVDREDIVFITRISTVMTGSYGSYNYEIKIPSGLRSYKGSSESVAFYYELK